MLMFPYLSSSSFVFVLVQVAIIAGNFDLAEIIKIHKPSDVGKRNFHINVFFSSAGNVMATEALWPARVSPILISSECWLIVSLALMSMAYTMGKKQVYSVFKRNMHFALLPCVCAQGQMSGVS